MTSQLVLVIVVVAAGIVVAAAVSLRAARYSRHGNTTGDGAADPPAARPEAEAAPPDAVPHPPQSGFAATNAVPEPEIYGLLTAGLGLIGFVARRRKKALSAA